MSLRSTSRSLLAAGIAASLLASAPALARTADEGGGAAVRTSSLAGTVSPSQDLRGEHARDAARAITHAPPAGPSQDLRGEHARDAARAIPIPLAPLQDLRGEHARDAARLTPMPVTLPPDAQAQPAKALPATTNDDGGRATTWLIVLVGLAGAAIAAGGTAGVRSHRHA
jgi:hypothetical protein